MFYSQFILAKKGPLGTIWIAAHLERKLRKNQVADTDIGVSVDSILCPDVPIALRLSSHLLLGVVRIYNRKVNYLFDDCSETLLKVKQAFRTSAVDLPPEESKAPYHSITLPETFDLDDFELPDNDFFQGNYVDHHVGSKEQITLQDTMEGVSYSTSKFGLDERFGDGDASGLDLDEELFLDRFDTAGVVDGRGDPQTSGGSMAPLKQNEDFEDRAGNSEPMVDYGDEDTDHMDYAEAPCTPGLMEEPTISNVKEASACDEHLDSEDHMGFTTKENSKNVLDEEKQEVNNWGSRDDTVLDAVPHMLIVEQNSEANEESSHVSKPVINLLHQAEQPTTTVPKLAVNIHSASDIHYTMFLQNTTIDVNNSCSLPTNKAHNDQGLDEFGLQKGLESTGLISTSQEPSDGLITRDPPLLDFDISGNVENSVVQQKSCAELDSGNPVFLENPVTQACQGTTNSHGLILDMHDNEASEGAPLLRPCKSRTELQSDFVTKSGCTESVDADIQSDIADASSFGREERTNQENYLKEIQVQEPVRGEAYHSTSNGQIHAKSTNSQDDPVKDPNDSVAAELSAPEKLLSVPEGQTDLYGGKPVEFSPRNLDGLDEGDAGSKTVAGRKRSFTESTLTEQSMNSVESSRQVRFKKTVESVPDDDDLLSSILAGRKYSLLKMKPTPLSEVTSTKRTRSAHRASASKRKLLMDDTMVLHGDAIRQQLTSTEDIRRIRKKAPCTRPEIAMIKNQHLEDGVFLESVFIGMSVELASLHKQVYDFSRIKVCSNDVILTTEITPENNGGVASESVMNNNVIESDGAPLAQADVAEQNEMETMNEPLSARDNEVVEAGENHLFSENRHEEVTCMDTEVIVSQDQIKPISNAQEANVEPLLDVPEVETVLQNSEAEVEPLGTIYQDNVDKGDVAADIVQMPNETEVADASDVFNNQKDSTATNLHIVDFDDGLGIVGDEGKENGGHVDGEGDQVRNDAMFSEMARDEVVPNATYEEFLDYNYAPNEFYNPTHEEQQHEQEEIMLDGGSMYTIHENTMEQAYQQDLSEAEFSGFDVHDQNDLNFSGLDEQDRNDLNDLGAINDTEFLNVDDDELNEMDDNDDDDVADGNENRITDNSGWSSRTRAVSKYLQTTFVNEAERGRKLLSMENLLIGKSRKEASRMFFETLVLKTRDYIHVEQSIPYDDIVIKPRTKMMKFDF